MNIPFQELNAIIADFVQIGYMEAIKAYEPSQDYIRLSEVKGWLKIMRIDKKRFDVLVERGIIKPARRGAGKNSPLYFSKKEIKQALAMSKVSKLIADDEIASLRLP